MAVSAQLVLRQRSSNSTSDTADSEGRAHEDAQLSNFEWQQRIFEHNHGYYTDDLSMLKESSSSSADYFRLLIIQPGGFDDPLVCWLITEDLSEEAEYEALSYTWGGRGSVHEISINGQDGFWITQNAFAALRRIRQKQEPRTLWIDAVCINQHHPLERSQQVANMHRICNWASAVLCWFGPCDGTLPGQEEDEICTVHETTGRENVDCQGSAHESRDRWWHRLWTVQEFCLAEKVQIHIGPHSYEYSELHRIAESHKEDKSHVLGQALKTFNNRQSISTHLTALKNDGLRRLGKNPTFNLRRMLLLTKQCVCNDQRDKIYAIVAPHDGNVPFEVDYSLTVHQVYALATVWMVKQVGNLDMLLDQNWPKLVSPAGRSWCPDFSYEGVEQFGDRALSLPVPHPGCEASGVGIVASVRLEGGHLVVSGVRIDHICVTAKGFGADSTLAICAKDLEQASNNDDIKTLVENLGSCKRYVRRYCPEVVERYKPQDGLSGALAAAISTSESGARVSKKEIRHSHLKSPAALASALADRCLFVTKTGYIGLASNTDILLRDEVVVVRGVAMPLVLRRGSGESGYRIVGHAYVHGLSNGTALWQDVVLLGE